MNKIIKKAIYLASVHKNEGLTERKLLKALHKAFDSEISFKDEDVIKRLKDIKGIEFKGDTKIIEKPLSKEEEQPAPKKGGPQDKNKYIAS